MVSIALGNPLAQPQAKLLIKNATNEKVSMTAGLSRSIRRVSTNMPRNPELPLNAKTALAFAPIS